MTKEMNYETRSVHLWYGDIFDTFVDENKELDQEATAHAFEDIVDQTIIDTKVPNGWVAEIISESLFRVDWMLLAELYMQD